MTTLAPACSSGGPVTTQPFRSPVSLSHLRPRDSAIHMVTASRQRSGSRRVALKKLRGLICCVLGKGAGWLISTHLTTVS